MVAGVMQRHIRDQVHDESIRPTTLSCAGVCQLVQSPASPVAGGRGSGVGTELGLTPKVAAAAAAAVRPSCFATLPRPPRLRRFPRWRSLRGHGREAHLLLVPLLLPLPLPLLLLVIVVVVVVVRDHS
jgi:hypothetical protein